jgi:hypothetical protein
MEFDEKIKLFIAGRRFLDIVRAVWRTGVNFMPKILEALADGTIKKVVVRVL